MVEIPHKLYKIINYSFKNRKLYSTLQQQHQQLNRLTFLVIRNVMALVFTSLLRYSSEWVKLNSIKL